MSGEKIPSYRRDLLLELAIAKGKNYDRETITPRTPSKKQVLLGLRNKVITNPNQILFEIQKLKRRIKLWILRQKAKDLNVYNDYIKDDAFKLAIHIYCKDKTVLEDLSKYQKSEPKRKTIFYNSNTSLTLDDWIKKEAAIRKIVNERLSDRDADSIATLEKIIPLGKNVRCEIAIDYKKHIVERQKSPKFPNRKGPYDAYPLRRMIATYDVAHKFLQVSAHSKNTPILIQALSEALTGSNDNFEIRKPSAEQAIKSFQDKDAQQQLIENQIRITEMLVKRVPWRGSPSFMHLKGEDLLETINQLDEAELPLIGKNLAILSQVKFEFENNRSLMINFENNQRDKTGDFTEEDEFKIYQILSSWGL